MDAEESRGLHRLHTCNVITKSENTTRSLVVSIDLTKVRQGQFPENRGVKRECFRRTS